MQLAHPADSEDFIAPFAQAAFSDQSYLPVIIIEADPYQTAVRDALLQLERAEVAKINTALRKTLVKSDHDRLILRTDWPNRYRCTTFQLPRFDVLGRVRSDG